MSLKNKNLIIAGAVSGLGIAAVGAYLYFKSKSQVSPPLKPNDSAVDNSTLNASSEIVINPDEFKITEENGILNADTVREILNLNLKEIQESYVEILQRHREQRRRLPNDDADAYAQAVQDYYDAISGVFKDHLKQILNIHHISKHQWIESLKSHVQNGNKIVILVLQKYEDMLKSKLQPKVKVTVAVYKEILKSLVKELTSERKDEEWKPVIALRINVGLIGFSRAWDKIYKSFGYEEEDVMNIDHIKADDEIPLLIARVQNTREKFIGEFGDEKTLEIWNDSP